MERMPSGIRSPKAFWNTCALLAGVALWLACWFGTRYVFKRWTVTKAVWAKSNGCDQYNLASMTHSTVHGIFIPLGVLLSFSRCRGIWGDFASEEVCSPLENIFALTISYFFVDLVLVVWYRGDLWLVYAIHHVLGSAPLVINCFAVPNFQFVLGFGLLIELVNPFVVTYTFLCMTGRRNTQLAKALTYWTLLAWLIIRIGIPTYLSAGVLAISTATVKATWYTVPSYLVGFLVTVFCYVVTFVVHVPRTLYYFQGQHLRGNELDMPLTEASALVHLEPLTEEMQEQC